MTTKTKPEKALASEAEGWLITAAECLSKFTTAELEKANNVLRGIAAMKQKIKEFTAPNIKRWHDGHKQAIAERDELLRPVEEAKAILDDKIRKYRAWEREETRKAQEAAAAAARAEAEAAREAEAQALKDSGEDDAAEMVKAAPIVIPNVKAPAPTKLEGTHIRTNWSAEITNKLELINFVAANPVFSHLLDVSMKEANKLAKAQKQDMMIPGLRAVSSETVVTKA